MFYENATSHRSGWSVEPPTDLRLDLFGKFPVEREVYVVHSLIT